MKLSKKYLFIPIFVFAFIFLSPGTVLACDGKMSMSEDKMSEMNKKEKKLMEKCKKKCAKIKMKNEK